MDVLKFRERHIGYKKKYPDNRKLNENVFVLRDGHMSRPLHSGKNVIIIESSVIFRILHVMTCQLNTNCNFQRE